MSKPRTIDAALTYGSFPVIFGGTMAAGVYAIAVGWDPVVTVAGLTGVAVLALLVLERAHPHRQEWLRSHDDLRTDLLHNAVNLWIPQLYTVLLAGGLTAVASRVSVAVGATLWPDRWPLLAQLLLALVIGEIGTYWIHRLMHETRFLWRFHAAHHSAPRLYWLNAGRFHPLDLFGQQFFALTPLILLGCGTGIIALHTLFTAIHGLFQHCNVRIRLGPLNWFFSMAELHRWHHSKRIDEANTNYGANIIWWDIVFRSRFLPRDREPPTDTGIQGLPGFPRSYWGQLLSPFRWKSIETSTGAS